MLSIRNLNKSYPQDEGSLRVLDQLDFEMGAGCSVALLGESGSGKSTLLHLIAGLDKPDSGDIEIAGQKLAGLSDSALAEMRRQQVSLVFQQFHPAERPNNRRPSRDRNDDLRRRKCYGLKTVQSEWASFLPSITLAWVSVRVSRVTPEMPVATRQPILDGWIVDSNRHAGANWLSQITFKSTCRIHSGMSYSFTLTMLDPEQNGRLPGGPNAG